MTNLDSASYIARPLEGEQVYVPPTVLRFALQSVARELLPNERVAKCLRFHAPNKEHVSVHRDKHNKAAYYSGLMVCASVWNCPVCASRISEQRRRELHDAVMGWTGGIAMVTYTASHKISTSLHDILDTVVSGVRAFKSGRKFQDIQDEYGWLGSVRSLEVTVSEKNGWHPHCHELVFFTNDLPTSAYGRLEIVMGNYWKDVLGRKGMLASLAHGLRLSENDRDLKDYITKWGHDPAIDNNRFNGRWTIEAEITKQTVKKAKVGGRTPTQLLLDHMQGDYHAGELWQEYAREFKGRNQLVWSRGLKKLLKLQPTGSDQSLAEALPAENIIYATLDADTWRHVIHLKLRGEILHAAANMTQEDFSQWLIEALSKP